MHDVVSVEHLQKYTGRTDEPPLGEEDSNTGDVKKAVRVCRERRIEEQ